MSAFFKHAVYDYAVIRRFALTAVCWGVLGMSVGFWIALQLIWPALNFDLPWTSFGRLRPLHTNLVIFAFAGSVLFATSYYVVQRTCQVRLFSDFLSRLTFWGWQAVLILGSISLPLGYTSSKEYAEFEWPIDLLITLVWVAYLINFFGTIARRKYKPIYVSNWFYGAFIIAIAVLHIVNNLEIPVSFWKSYSFFSGTTDAMVQWWYGHNAVGFLLTAGFLAMMYYYLPKQVNRPVYSYRLSIVHFWALISLYVWVGSHHLHYTALPDWIQSLGMIMSVILLVPSWGGMINGIMTISGAWHKLKTDPILRFMALSVAFYGMSTFEGPLMAIKTVNIMSHYTDWTIAHVHSGALGWVGMISFAGLYHMIPVLLGRQQGEMYSIRLINVHCWLALIGLIFYATAMWINGVMQGLMWHAVDWNGSLLYSFVETLEASRHGYMLRALGGFLYLLGILIMLYNSLLTYMKYRQTTRVDTSDALQPAPSY